MYNPEYCARPHIVALNKMDLQDAAHLQAEIAAEVLTMAHRIQVGHAPGHVHSIRNGCGSVPATRHISNTLPCSTCSCFTACSGVFLRTCTMQSSTSRFHMAVQLLCHQQTSRPDEVMVSQLQNDSPEGNPQPSLPDAVVCVSAQAGTGLDDLHAALEPLLPAPSTATQASASSSTVDGWG
jgi:predicted GTPase